MTAPTNIQIIKDPNGKPAFVVIPYHEYIKPDRNSDTYIPHEVVAMMVDNDWTIVRSWREYLGVTQAEMASRMGISQSAYSQQETNQRLRKSSMEKIANALGVSPDQLNV